MEVDVPVEQIEDEAQMAENLRRELGPQMVGAVISCRPEYPEFPASLDRQLRRPHVRGLHRVLHVANDDISRGYLFRETLRRLAATGHCIAAFGWNRVVRGSDWPICLAGGPLSRWVEATRSIIANCSEHERSALMEANAARIYRL